MECQVSKKTGNFDTIFLGLTEVKNLPIQPDTLELCKKECLTIDSLGLKLADSIFTALSIPINQYLRLVGLRGLGVSRGAQEEQDD